MRAGQPGTGPVDPQQHRRQAVHSGQPAQFQRALDVHENPARCPGGAGRGELGRCLGRAAERDRRRAGRHGKGQFPTGRDLKTVHCGRERGDDVGVAVGLDGVQQQRTGRQRSPHGGGGRPQHGPVVDVGAHRPVERGQRGADPVGDHRNGLGTGT